MVSWLRTSSQIAGVDGGAGGNISNTNFNNSPIWIVLTQKANESLEGDDAVFARRAADVLTALVEGGALDTKKENFADLGELFVRAVQQSTLTRDLVESQQFHLPRDRNQYLLGGPNRIVYDFKPLFGGAHFKLNGRKLRLEEGQSAKFSHNGLECEIVFDGLRAGGADMTTFCK